MKRDEEILARARALIGVRFRLQGRSAEHGLDCIGLAALATGVSSDRVRRDYKLRSPDPNSANDGFTQAGFVRVQLAAAGASDLLLVRTGPAQLHVVMLTGKGFLHADIRLRRVVEVPGPAPWPAISAWRHPQVVADRNTR